ncbi:MAG: helix-hairpin-helix domain-containing protein [Bacteriovoracaceae bacterium]|nr:helix-hairpin-helix domain-containing protein [Bacteroidota bacterium]
MCLQFLFIDFNAFFASVEQQEQPVLRGKPVVVLPVMAENTACIAASYEAKKFGIKTGTTAKDARNMCPEVTILAARPSLYVQYHKRLIEAVESCVPVHSVRSIDEMACTLSGSQQQKEQAINLAKKIKRTIASQVGEYMRASIGIAPNIFLAKTASDMQKPDGLVVIEQEQLPSILYRLELQDLTGIGRNMVKRLYRNGIYTVEQLCSAEKDMLRTVWGGIEGNRMYERLRGIEPPLPVSHHTTVGHSHMLTPSERNISCAVAVMHRMLQKSAMRLRNMKYRTSTLYVGIRYYNNKQWSEQITFTDTSDTLLLTQALTALLDRRPVIRETPLQVSVTLLNLTPEAEHTPSLFDNEERSSALNAAVDELNLRFGKQALYFGKAHSALESSPARIAFHHIPDIEIEDGKGGRPKKKKGKPKDIHSQQDEHDAE